MIKCDKVVVIERRYPMFKELIIKNRSTRGYDRSRIPTQEEMYEMIDCARLSASSMSVQPLKFYPTNSDEETSLITENVHYAGALPELGLPLKGTEPPAYILVCQDLRIHPNDKRFLKDVGICAQSMSLCAVEMGLNCLMIGAYNPETIRQVLGLPEYYTVLLVLAVGKGIEHIELIDTDVPAPPADLNDEAAMEAYKNARYHNTIDELIVPARVIDQKMDRCADAMRRESRRDSWRNNSNTWRNAPARPVSYNTYSDLVDVRSNGMVYTTTANNRGCRVLSVKNEFNYTVVEMEFINNGCRSINISIDGDTYLKDRNTGARYSLNEAKGIRINASTNIYSGESQVFRLYFNRISGGCRSVDIVEPGTSDWKFYNVPVRM